MSIVYHEHHLTIQNLIYSSNYRQLSRALLRATATGNKVVYVAPDLLHRSEVCLNKNIIDAAWGGGGHTAGCVERCNPAVLKL